MEEWPSSGSNNGNNNNNSHQADKEMGDVERRKVSASFSGSSSSHPRPQQHALTARTISPPSSSSSSAPQTQPLASEDSEVFRLPKSHSHEGFVEKKGRSSSVTLPSSTSVEQNLSPEKTATSRKTSAPTYKMKTFMGRNLAKLFSRSVDAEISTDEAEYEIDGSEELQKLRNESFSAEDTIPSNNRRGSSRAERMSLRLRDLKYKLAAAKQQPNTSLELITYLQGEVESLQNELKQLKIDEFPMVKSVQQYEHQLLEINAENYKNFLFKGTIIVKNKYQEELETFDLVPDSIVAENLKDYPDSQLQIFIDDVKLPFQEVNNLNLTMPYNVTLYYMCQHKDTSRFDHMFAITYEKKHIFDEMKRFLQNFGGKEEYLNFCRSSSTDQKTNTQFKSLSLTSTCRMFEATTSIHLIPRDTDEVVPVINDITIIMPLHYGKESLDVSLIMDPFISTKNFHNFWFHLEIVDTFGNVMGPFVPSEQYISLSETYYYLDQEIPLQRVMVLGNDESVESARPKGEPKSPYETNLTFSYYVKNKTVEDSSMFLLANFTVTQAEIVACSQGFQRPKQRFKLEKYVGLDRVHAIFHFYVASTIVPTPSTKGDPIQVESGMWLLERITFGVRVA